MDPSRVASYDFEHPPEAVAQVPAPRREQARLLFVRRGFADGARADTDAGEQGRGGGDASAEAGAEASSGLREGRIPDLLGVLRAGDLLVLNETWVPPARLAAHRTATGGKVSVLVLAATARAATVLLGTRGTIGAGETLDVQGDTWRVEAVLGEGRFAVAVVRGRDVPALMADAGRMPLPPYIERAEDGDPRDVLDRERYQTTFARGPTAAGGEGASRDPVGANPDAFGEAGAPLGTAAAAPTAGLHLTPALLDAARARGVEVARLRLDVGEGTFRPMRGETLDEHVMHEERYAIPDAVAEAYAATRARGGRVIAVGTTSVRALESAVSDDGRTLHAGPGATRLFIRPGYRFRAVDALLTNFHQPRSTLLVLVSAFAGAETIRRAYAHAVAAGFRLFSYGDAMWLGDV
ncbi:MAG: S-adenosylmethionine:tRNA ribosyltransferase-isomerase [Planctomycetes bacterium]|nr:S-adenosylmethionine:tRNA ribosyltransferase-isomerase [Planctomycetota bacterium]